MIPRTVPLLAGALALLLLPSSGLARGPGKAAKRVDKICERLDCNEKQREGIAATLQDLHKQQRVAMTRARDLAATIRAELEKARPDEEVILEATEKLARQEAVLQDARHEAVMNIHGQLNARQRADAAPLLTRLLLAPPRPSRGHGKHRGQHRGPEGSPPSGSHRGR